MGSVFRPLMKPGCTPTKFEHCKKKLQKVTVANSEKPRDSLSGSLGTCSFSFSRIITTKTFF